MSLECDAKAEGSTRRPWRDGDHIQDHDQPTPNFKVGDMGPGGKPDGTSQREAPEPLSPCSGVRDKAVHVNRPWACGSQDTSHHTDPRAMASPPLAGSDKESSSPPP